MSLSTFSDLKTSIANYLDRDDLTTYVPDFIALAESRHKNSTQDGGIRIKEMLTRSSITVDSRQISLPSNFLESVNFRLLTNPVTVMSYVNYHEMTRLRDETSGKPTRFTIANEIEFDKSPDSSYSGEIVYYKYETPLSDGNTSNNILARAPGAYLYGALLEASPFLMDDPRIAVWGGMYKSIVDGLNAQTMRGRVSGPIISRSSGATP